MYEGVDREIYTDGVAVTSLAENYGKGSETYWADAFVESGKYWKTTVGLLAGTVLMGLGAYIFKHASSRFVYSVAEDLFLLNEGSKFVKGGVSSATHSMCNQVKDFDTLLQGTEYGFHTTKEKASAAVNDLIENGLKAENNMLKFNLLKGFKIGLTVFAIILAVVDIVMTVITLYNYYNRDHLPIPHHMVDITYNEDHETSYIAYKSVLDNNGKYGDTNGGSGKQWLALYYTKDRDAGDPILAPDGDNNAFLLKTGSDGRKTPVGYSPLHFFGTPSTPQNLTYADGENGWSYNDNSGGVYMYFKRDANVFYAGEEDGDDEAGDVQDNKAAASAISNGGIVALSFGAAALGILLGIGGSAVFVKKRKKKA